VILVAVGTSQFPFDRLLRAVEDLPRTEPIIVQHGPSDVRPTGASCEAFVPLEKLARLVREARVVVTHAGVGSILLALANGRKPYVVPRLRAFGETVDDHQLESARRFASAGVVTLVEQPELLAAAIVAGTSNGSGAAVTPADGAVPLVEELRDYLGTVIGRSSESVTP
jgi:UDP-N-acetylglucosamine--N-acetylmuramyl-(pentapeptide) pyrophosphoryl-undecaprenol N-acetylglucosamine transferase